MRDFRRRKPSMAEARALIPRARRHPRLRHCVHYWPFLEGGGLQVVDLMGPDIGTLTGMSITDWVSGPRGPVLNFDGTDNMIAATGPTFTSSFSISAWIFARTQTGADGIVMRTQGTPFAHNYYFQLDAGKLMLGFFNGGYPAAIEPTVSMATNTWYHVAGTYNVATQTIEVFVNGVSRATQGSAGVPTPGGSTQFAIGRDRAQSASPFDGWIDDVRMYTRALLPQEVLSLAQRPGLEMEWAWRRQQKSWVSAQASLVLYPALERGIRGMNRGLALGG